MTMRKLLTGTGATAGALLLTVSMSGTAQADDGFAGVRGCRTPGAYGDYYFSNWHGPDAKIKMKMSLTDMSNDRYHVRLRMISKDVNGTVKYWPWRANTSGSGTTKTWETSAEYDRGLFNIGIQVARLDGSRIVNSCTDW